MRTMGKMAVLLVTLLLLIGVAIEASAVPCAIACYELTYTNLDAPNGPISVYARFAFCSNNTGSIDSPIADANMALFFDPMKDEALAISAGCAGYFKFHGDDLYVVQGIGACLGGPRLSVRGHQVDLGLCDPT